MPRGSLGYLLLKWQDGQLTLYGGGTRNAKTRTRVGHFKFEGRAFSHVLFVVAFKLSARARGHKDEEVFLRMGEQILLSLLNLADSADWVRYMEDNGVVWCPKRCF
jgi:hypothetical protein